MDKIKQDKKIGFRAKVQTLFKRIKEYLKVLDNGDYQGREIKIIS